ncbi:MAG: N-acetylmuramoyl-L-alanine amidase, partial [Clostridia bacterium]|nr:N-acetylmuramoyl-L-alanine amidase [Clostridia bacterium]
EVGGDSGWKTPDYVDVQLIAKNEYSRPGKKLDAVNGIVVHYVANPGSSAAANRSYFAGLAQSGETYASSNFIIGLEGEVIQCVPADEVAYASNKRNSDTLSIECCHPDETGVFTHPTYESLVQLCTDICIGFDLDPLTDIIRHYDVTGKMCPLYFVEHEDEWKDFLGDVAEAVADAKSAATSEK